MSNITYMKYLLDVSPSSLQSRLCDRVAGQFLTPLTNYRLWEGLFAVDNGGYSGFDADAFKRLLSRIKDHAERCLFVSCPDIVGSCRRTLELFRRRHEWITGDWPVALVAQDGIEDADIPWDELDAIFIGGRDPWKDSQAAVDVVVTAKMLGKHAHVGRVNSPARYRKYSAAGADTCDGTGVVRYSHMMRAIVNSIEQETLFDSELNEQQK